LTVHSGCKDGRDLFVRNLSAKIIAAVGWTSLGGLDDAFVDAWRIVSEPGIASGNLDKPVAGKVP
jgi:hypothetical protein